MNEPRTLLAARIHGLDIAYDLGEGHDLLGRRMPDLDLDTADGPTRVSTLLQDAEPLLLDLGHRPGSASHTGPTGCGWSSPDTQERGNCRSSARWRLLRRY